MNWEALIMIQPMMNMTKKRAALNCVGHDDGGRLAIGMALSGCTTMAVGKIFKSIFGVPHSDVQNV